MGNHNTTIWDKQPHTRAKHEILRRYLDAWLPIMSRYNERLLILDGFAGPGEYTDGSDGSPLIAVNALIQHPHTSNRCEYVFLFNDDDPKRRDNLNRLLSSKDYPSHIKIHIESRPFADAVATLLDSLAGKALAPMFAFVDPFGFKDVPMETLRRLFASDKGELLIYLDLNSLIRFGTSGIVDERLDDLFGSDDYKNAPATGVGRWNYFLDLYERQLKSVCSFTYTRSFVMFGHNNKPVCALVYATRHRKGMEVMKDAMWKVDPTGSFSFSDFAGGTQTFLQDEPDLTELASAISSRFSNQTVDVETVEVFVYTETPNRKSHTRGALKVLEEVGKIVSVSKTDGKPRRRNTYPEGSLITFV